MSSTPKFAHVDTRKADGFYVQFVRLIERDETADRPDERDDGFWPSRNPKDAGYVSPRKFASEMAKAKERMVAWERDDWYYVGVRAQARCLIVSHGVGTCVNLDSPGLWGIESDSGEDYLDEVYTEEIAQLKSMLASMANPVYED